MKKFGLVDFIIITGVIAALLVGLYTVKHYRQTADKQIEATSQISFQVFLRGVTVTGEEFPIKVNDKTFITIRNVPYTELTVSDVSSQPRKTFSPAVKSLTVEDPAQPALLMQLLLLKIQQKLPKTELLSAVTKLKWDFP